MGNLKLKSCMFLLVASILLFASCKEKKKTIDDIIFMTKGCYSAKNRFNFTTFCTFKKISEDVLYFEKLRFTGINWISSDCNLKIDESGNNLVGVGGSGTQFLIPIPKNENDPIFYNGNTYEKTTNCK